MKVIKILKLAFVIIALVVAAVVFFGRFAPPETVERVMKNSGPAKEILCQYPVRVAGDAMAPIFQNGQTVILSKCIEDSANIPIGTVVLYDRQGGLRLSIIRERILDENGVLYRLSQETRQNEVDEVRSDRIAAVYEPKK